MNDVDISDKKIKPEIEEAFTYMLQNILNDEKVGALLNFDIINIDGHFRVIGKNAISALWLSGLFPANGYVAIKNNVFKIDNRRYRYNNTTNELTYEEIHE